MPTRTILVAGNGTGTLSFQLDGPDVTEVEAVLAEIDASGAGDTTATLTATSPAGNDVAAVPQGSPVSGGGLGRATWALRLAEDGGSAPIIGSAYATGHLATTTNPPTNQPPIIDDALHGVTSAGGEWTIQKTGLYLWWITVLLSYRNGQPAFGLIAAIFGVTPALTKQIATRLSSPVAVAGGDLFGGESGLQLVTLNAGDVLGVFLGTGNGASFVELRGGAVGLMRVA